MVASGAERIRAVLGPVYAALELGWDPATAGSVADELPGVGLDEVEGAILAELRRRFEVTEVSIDPELERAARSGRDRHEVVLAEGAARAAPLRAPGRG